MAAYASIEDAILLYGDDYVTLSCDRDRDGQLDIDTFEMALLNASNQIDGYIVGREPLPLDPVPPFLKKICVDIAIYDCCSTQDVLTEQREKRHAAAVKFMTEVGHGKIKLSTAGVSVGANQSQTTTTQVASANEIVQVPCSRRMTRNGMRFV